MLRIVTDGSADMPENWKNEFEINVLPLNVQFENETFIQGVDIGPDNFYRMVRERKIVPKTSLPSPQQVVEFYRKIAQKTDEILSIHLTSTLSGTFSVIQTAAKELKGELNINAFDSGAGSAVLGFMCREARLMERAGASLQDILARLDSISRRLTVIFTVENLEFVRMSGRIGYLQSTLASLLKLNPVIVLKDGLLLVADKVRTRQRALEHILAAVRNRIGNRKAWVAVVHAADPITAAVLMQRSRELFNLGDLVMADLSIPVAAHLGPGTVGIVAIPIEEG